MFELSSVMSILGHTRESRSAADAYYSRGAAAAPQPLAPVASSAQRAVLAEERAAVAARPPGASFVSSDELLRRRFLPARAAPTETRTSPPPMSTASAARQISPSRALPTSAATPAAAAAFSVSTVSGIVPTVGAARAAAAESAALLTLVCAGSPFSLVVEDAGATATSVFVRAVLDGAAIDISTDGATHRVRLDELAGVDIDAPRRRVTLLPRSASTAAPATLVAASARTAADWGAGLALLAAMQEVST